jgi:GT2 family glycosyltransferase
VCLEISPAIATCRGDYAVEDDRNVGDGVSSAVAAASQFAAICVMKLRNLSAPVTVLIPTIGRVKLLDRCLQSIAACDPPPGEIVVVDQSGDSAVSDLVSRFHEFGARVVRSDRRSVAVGRNVGLRLARYDVVLVTDDDCGVAPSWVETGWAHMRAKPQAIVTGRVVPEGDPRAVPSTKDDPEPRDYTGEIHCGVLFPNNMALDRSAVLKFGGFDERVHGAEDNDLCYRWLRAGHTLCYEPDMVVWHDDWRSHAELERLWVAYARAQGGFYAKQIRHGDWAVMRHLTAELWKGLRSKLFAPLSREPRWTDPQRATVPWLLVGLAESWRRFSK